MAQGPSPRLEPRESAVMDRNDRLRQRILSGRSDANIRFVKGGEIMYRRGGGERPGVVSMSSENVRPLG